MNGATKTIARASARGITRIAAIKQKVANSKSIARDTNASHCLRATRKDSLMIQINGAISTHWRIKRTAVICPMGTLDDASLAATSSKGAVKQNPSMSVTPVSMLSENDVEDVAFTMIAYKYVYKRASRR